MAGIAGSAAALAASRFPLSRLEASPASPAAATAGVRNKVWVWAFSEDGGNPETVRAVLAQHGLDIIFKTHDGTEWTKRSNGLGVTGPADVRKWADFFESAGVGFHAWSVVNGTNPLREAEMTSQALDSGARSMYFDLETPEGRHYWHGTNEDALTLGREVRRLKPDATLLVAPDARPWKVKEVPMGEFASFCNGIAPQLYWELFGTPGNFKLMANYGFPAGPDGMTPELLLNAANGALAQFGLPIHPIGGGAAKLNEWQRFVSHAYNLGMPSVSVWRYGTAVGNLLPTLQRMPAPQPAPRPPEPTPTPTQPAATPTATQPTATATATQPAATPSTAGPSNAAPAQGEPSEGSELAAEKTEASIKKDDGPDWLTRLRDTLADRKEDGGSTSLWRSLRNHSR
jgi:hypothetical protein